VKYAKIIWAVRRRTARNVLRMGDMGAWNEGQVCVILGLCGFRWAGHRDK